MRISEEIAHTLEQRDHGCVERVGYESRGMKRELGHQAEELRRDDLDPIRRKVRTVAWG